MQTEKIIREFISLPPEGQKEIAAFIAFLKARYKSFKFRKAHRKTLLAKEPFIGIWGRRKDMKDSTLWVRNLRKSEWIR